MVKAPRSGGRACLRANLLRAIFGASLLLGTFWTVGLVWDVAVGHDLSLHVLAICAALVTTSVLTVLVASNGLLISQNARLGKVFMSFLRKTVLAYVALVPLTAGLTYFAIACIGNSAAHDVSIAVTLVAVWLPLWWAPGIGAVRSRPVT